MVKPASKEKVHEPRHHAVVTEQRCVKHSAFVKRGSTRTHKHLAHMKNYTLEVKSLTLASHLLGLQGCVGLGALPDGKAECDLVDKVRQVVDQIEGGVIGVIEDQIAEEVACWVDWPANGDNKFHDRVRALHMATCVACFLACLTSEHLVQDESPTRHTKSECWPSHQEVRFPSVAEGQHHNSATEKTEEHAATDLVVHCGEDEVELNHLQRNGDGPIDVSVQDRASSNCDPELAHVEVMDRCDQGHQGTYVQGSLPLG